ncbi:hypothetical protein EJD97_018144 [Solanum chilense]|uniref:Uncharacterized protein n=1 Tax=Solanum chilense TaxID=4083 RepID=A0A6N2ADZ1_SOLCI|nr:hypothetical protein EJD97_018144 [Solanum chilense]
MANLIKLEFIALQSTGKNYLSRVLDAEIHLDAMGLGDTIKIENKASKQDCAKAMIFLRHRIDKILKLNISQLQDFKSIHEYNSAMFRNTTQICGDTVDDVDMLKETFYTFHASNVLLQQQYREKGFKKYSELISHLLVAKQNNDLLMKNHENHSTESTPLPELNEVYAHHARRGRGRG